MTGSVRWVGLLLVGAVLRLPVSGQAQTAPLKLADLVGSWEQVTDSSWKKSADPNITSVRRTFTFRSDSTWFETLTTGFRADTLSCTQKNKEWGYLPGDTMITRWSWWQDHPRNGRNGIELRLYKPGDTFVTDWSGPKKQEVVLRDQQIAFSGFGIFTRSASPAGPARDYIAPGPTTQPATGKLAELVGTWERIPGQGSRNSPRDPTLVRETFMVRPDLTHVTTELWKDGAETFSCASEWYWKELAVSGDTLQLDKNYKYVVEGQQLSVFYVTKDPKTQVDSLTKTDVYKRVTSSKQP